MAFSDRLIEARKKKKLSQEKLAKISGVSQAAICFIEKGQRSPTEETMKLLASALDLDVSDLLDDAQKKLATEGELDEVLAGWMRDLTPQELQRLFDFAEGLKAARKS